MKITNWYRTNFESEIEGRYITYFDQNLILDKYQNWIEISSPGLSELGKEIKLLKIGSGEKVVLGWSQMHGNESTTTKTIFDFLKFLDQKLEFRAQIRQFLDTYTLFLLPILNPDGASRYTRENANFVDLNRDARQLSQNESRLLREVFESVNPELCLNLHDQRSIYGLDSGKPATISFLAPSANEDRSCTTSRIKAMEHIVRMNTALQEHIPGQIGRYDDSFNSNCVGDAFQMAGVPTILFEAGHYKNDYQREKTREFLFYSLLELFGITEHSPISVDYESYFDIPENKQNYKDIILRNVKTPSDSSNIDICIQFSEVFIDGYIKFEGLIDQMGDFKDLYGHREVDLQGEEILINSQENIYVGQKVSIIVKKKDKSEIIFQ